MLVFTPQLLNLALEKQAVGRVYRLGQSRPVTVSWMNEFSDQILEKQTWSIPLLLSHFVYASM